jgi:hypothetical protein
MSVSGRNEIGDALVGKAKFLPDAFDQPRAAQVDGRLARPKGFAAWCAVLGAGLVLCSGCSSKRQEKPPAPAAGPIRLRDLTGQTGIDFVHTDGSSGRRYIIEAMSAGLAVFDYNADGLIDVYFLNGSPLLGTRVDKPPTNALYRNHGNWRFTNVTEEAGVGDTGFGLGVTVGDYDNDGDPDLYLNNYGPNVLYRNNGDGTFTDVTDRAGVANGNLVGAGASFLDMDGDGDLDLYVGNYLEFSYDIHVERVIDGFPSYPVPKDYEPVPDTVYRNNGDGTFKDVSAESGVKRYAGTSMGMVCADYDTDGDTDVFVLNDVRANFFFQNDGLGNFEEVAVLNGTAYNVYGIADASMGVDCGDCNNDGLLDFFMTSYQGQMPVYYRNMGSGLLEDASLPTNAGDGAFAYVNWGVGLVDFDNDGDRDVYIANGHTEDNIDLRDDSTAYRVRNLLLMNTGRGKFVNVTDSAGDGMLPVHASRGAGFDDLDNDGDVDAVILNSRQKSTVLKNESPGGNHWLQIELRGVHANRDGVGAQVRVVAGDSAQIDEVHSGRGYQGHHGSRLHFGLGKHKRVDRIEVRWIGGGVDVLVDVEGDQLIRIGEGAGQLRRGPTGPPQPLYY